MLFHATFHAFALTLLRSVQLGLLRRHHAPVHVRHQPLHRELRKEVGSQPVAAHVQRFRPQLEQPHVVLHHVGQRRFRVGARHDLAVELLNGFHRRPYLAPQPLDFPLDGGLLQGFLLSRLDYARLDLQGIDSAQAS